MTQAAPSNEGREAIRLTRRPWWTRMSAAQFLMILVGVLAFLANLVLLRGQEELELVAVAAADLNPGAVLDVDRDLRFVEIAASSELIGNSIARGDVGAVDGLIVAAPIRDGDLVNRSQLRDVAAVGDLRAMSIPVDPANATGGKIGIGDRVDVIAVDGGVARFVLVGAEVIERSAESSGNALAGTRSFYIVVGVTADQALEVASAMDTAEIQIVRSTGAAAPERLVLDPDATEDETIDGEAGSGEAPGEAAGEG